MSADFTDHLEELRKRILISLVSFVLFAVIAYFFSHHLIEFLILPLRQHKEAQLIFQTPSEAFLTHLKVSGFAGLLFSLPVMFFQFWFFVSPGLYAKEKKTFLPLCIISIALFFAGAALAFFLVIPWGLAFLLSFQTDSLKPLFAIGPYFSFLINIVLVFGVLFDFPVVLAGLVKMGVLRVGALAKGRKITIVGIFVVSAVLTPADPISQIMLAIPLWLLFELTLIVAKTLEPASPRS